MRSRQTDEHQQAMRNLPLEPNDGENRSPGAQVAPWIARNLADFSSILLELARAQRGFQFYGETDKRRKPLADRAHRALGSELARAGTIAFELHPNGFQLQGVEGSIEPAGALLGLRDAFRNHGLKHLEIDPSLSTTALIGFLDLLGRGSGHYPSPDHLARTLAARDSQGIRINGIDTSAQSMTPKLTTTPPRAAASLASTRQSSPNSSEVEGQDADEKLSLDRSPLEAPSGDDRGERLRARLIDLDATIEDRQYCSRVTDIVYWAEDLWNEELHDECYRAMLVLADHAVGHGGRTGVQARAAFASFASLASGDRLANLIDRATESTAESGVRAAQLLLQLGELAVPTILDRLSDEADPDRAAPLRGLILTQGEIALPYIIAAIQGQNEGRARLGIRLAGELQNPEALPALIKTLEVRDLSRRIETIRALSFLPGPESKQALTNALASDLEEIAAAAGEAIASTDGSEAVPALLDVLEASIQTTKTKLARTLIEVLGQLGDERAVPRLCAILERRPVLRRAHWHAIQLSTIDALAVLPTKEARRSIERAALHAPGSVRDRARLVLESPAKPAGDPLRA